MQRSGGVAPTTKGLILCAPAASRVLRIWNRRQPERGFCVLARTSIAGPTETLYDPDDVREDEFGTTP